jgi:threonine synthase
MTDRIFRTTSNTIRKPLQSSLQAYQKVHSNLVTLDSVHKVVTSMRYNSTRGSKAESCSFEEAILGGYAPDKGLYVPERIPRVDSKILCQWASLEYIDLATEILSLFVTEIPKADIHQICYQSYEGFDQPIVPIIALQSKSLFVAELFHGPTFCFKDLGLRTLINFMAYFAKKRNQRITLLVATTGDTGPAAVRAVQDSECDLLSIVVHFPKGQISDFQRKQLTTVDSPRVKIVEFEGTGDDMDGPIKNITTDKSFSNTETRLVCGINSFNIGRPLAQMTHFVWTYLRIAESLGIAPGDPSFELDIVIPTGAMGNLASCRMAREIGVPIGVTTAAVNVNDFTDVAFTTGVVSKPTCPMKMTLSEAINIQVPYNLERVLFYLTDQRHELIQAWYESLEANDSVQLGQQWLTKLQRMHRSVKVTDDELCNVTREVLETFNYWVDPHTAVAFQAAKRLGYWSARGPSEPALGIVAVMATASPCKFQSAVTTAIGQSKWSEYEEHYFPTRGRDILEKSESPPICYPADPTKTIEENQITWEQMARDIVASL